ncbi:MAG: inorganic phosphate transporter [Chloroflexi bacterium]|nr:inorganic phosphate transporter [Chloroflexota bacterium]
MDPIILLVSLVAIALVFDFLNGFHDSANVVATMISSGALPPWGALVVASLAEFAGPFLFGMAVAATIGKDIVTPETVTISVVFAALGSAITWNLVTWYFGIPSSSSHALIGGVAGAVVAGYGLSHIHFDGITKIFLALFLSPPLGMVAGYLFMRLVVFLARGASPGVNQFFKRSQILTSVALALSHGSNDAQKTMGIITMSLVTLRFEEAFVVPVWVIVACAGAIALGVATGGWRIIKTLGGKMYKVRPVHGFTAQAASAAVILGGALLGGPVSTTQVVSSAIMGVGSAERLSKVRWEVAYNIVMAWAVTIPASAAVAALLYFAIASFLG